MANPSYVAYMTSTTADTKPAHYVMLMMLKTTRNWLELSHKQRHEFVESTVNPILQKHPAVSMRYLESEGFSARVTDVAMWETNDLLAYQAVVEDLRETQFWDHYFEVVELLACIEDAYKRVDDH